MEQVRFAVVGTKSIGKYHIEGIHKTKEAVLAAVCDIREDVAIKTAEDNGLDRYYTDYDEMLKTDIIKVISNYMEIDTEELDIQITQTQSEDNNGTVPVLYANIPIKSMRKMNQG